MILLSPNNTQLDEELEEELLRVSNCFTAELISDLPCVNLLVDHIERYQGKMLRPTLVLVSGMASTVSSNGDATALTNAHRVVATVVEMIHMATLVHDDVLDEARTRRGGHTINHLKGNEAAVMLGDYLISHAYHLCSSLNQPAINHLIANATNLVCEGELLQLANRDNWGLDEQTYFEIIRRKTASLCGTCCRAAAMLNDAPHEIAEKLADYGEKLGISYQIIDDVLDLVGTEQTVGKTLGRDLQKGKLTLPLIHYLNHAGPSQRQQMIELLQSPASENDDPRRRLDQVQRVHDLMSSSGSVAHATNWATSLIEQAKASVAELPPTASQQLLLSMADAILTRQF